MSAAKVSREGQRVTVEVSVELTNSMLSTEESIQQALNEAGTALTGEALRYFDTDGSLIEIGGQVWRTKGQQPKEYQTPYGAISVERHVYQRSGGGKTYCPLERGARIVITSTPRLAKQVSWKMAQMAAPVVCRDLSENHGRKVAHSYVQRLSEAVAAVVQAKDESWRYVPPELDAEIATVAVGLDGTTLLLCEAGWREAMVGTVSLYDARGDRQHTIYLGATPEYGRATFLKRLTREVERAKQRYPDATFIGIADGAESNWRYLEQHTDEQILDFYHASGYLGAVAEAMFPRQGGKQTDYRELLCHQLKHDAGAAKTIGQTIALLQKTATLSKKALKELDAAATYFANHQHQMDYAAYRDKHYPIGSGVTEAACKTLVKQRLCASGMRWKEKGAAVILSLRELVLTPARWQQFWDKLNQYGFPAGI